MTNRIPVAFAVTYLIGVIGAAWFLAQLAPRLMGVNLEEECRRLERRCRADTSRSGARRDIEYRAYAVQPGSPLVGRGVHELEQLVRRRAPFRRTDPAARSDARHGRDDDGAGRRHAGGHGPSRAAGGHARRAGARRSRSRRQGAARHPRGSAGRLRHAADVDGRTLADLARDDAVRSVYLRRIMRAGTPVAILPGTQHTPRRRGHARRPDAPARRGRDAAWRARSPDRRRPTWCSSHSALSLAP